MSANKLIFFVVFLVTTVHTLEDKESVINNKQKYDNKIAQIFNTTKFSLQPKIDNNNDQQNQTCICVPYYRCYENGRIITSGETLIDIRLKDNDCSSYLEKCCKYEDLTPPSSTPSSSLGTTSLETEFRSSLSCGYRHEKGFQLRITGDTNNESQFAEFPWMVAVLEVKKEHKQVLEKYRCGGAIIHPQAVITAAHCVENNKKHLKIRAGEWDTKTQNEPLPHQERDVAKIEIHSNYGGAVPIFDVAILYLEKPFDLLNNVNPICLPPSSKIPNEKNCFVTGWGKNNFENSTYQAILKKISLPIVRRFDCQKKLRRTRLGQYFNLDLSFVCAGGEKGKDACIGDGGGPLVCPIHGLKDRYYQAGIVSWGIGCGTEDVPGVYGNIPMFRTWIDGIMKKFGLKTTVYEY